MEKHTGVVFTSDGKRNKEFVTPIVKATSFLCEIQSSVVTKRELSKTVKLPVVKSVLFRSSPMVINLGQ